MIGKTIKKPLCIFDFDDTLVSSKEKIHVHHDDGSVTTLSTHQFAMYECARGDAPDFSEFERCLNGPDILSTYDTFLDRIDEVGVKNVVVLTARSFSSPPTQWLESMGVVGVRVHALAASEARAKIKWIRQRIIDEGHDYIEFYDDSPKNVRAVMKLRREFPCVRIVTKCVR